MSKDADCLEESKGNAVGGPGRWKEELLSPQSLGAACHWEQTAWVQAASAADGATLGLIALFLSFLICKMSYNPSCSS